MKTGFDGGAVRLAGFRHPVPVRVLRHAFDERQPDDDRHRLCDGGRRCLVRRRGCHRLFVPGLWALDRFVYLLTGLCLLTPLATFGIGRWINGAGACLAVALLIRERTRRRTRQATGPEQIAADATVHQPRPEHRPTA